MSFSAIYGHTLWSLAPAAVIGAGVGLGLGLLGRAGLGIWSWRKAKARRAQEERDAGKELQARYSKEGTPSGDATVNLSGGGLGEQDVLPPSTDAPPGAVDVLLDPLTQSLQQALQEKQEQLRLARLELEEQRQRREVGDVAVHQMEEAMGNLHREGLEEVNRVENLAAKYMDERDLYR